MQERCGQCRFNDGGRCRRRSPAVVSETHVTLQGSRPDTVWPEVRAFDWCGEFKRKQESELAHG